MTQTIAPVIIGNSIKLRDLEKLMGTEVLESLLQDAINSLKEMAHELEEAIARKDSDLIFNVSHTIKGTCGSLFAEKVCQIAKDIEANAANQTYVENCLPAFRRAASETNQWWAGHLRQHRQ